MTVLVAILGLILLIVIHELGHMLAAKALGVNVPEFGVGFGPALFKKKIGKTVYSFRVILLGGFAKMEGMEGVASVEEVKEEERGPGSYLSKPPWRRAVIIFAGPFANLLAAVLIFAVVFMTIPEPSTTVETVVPETFASEAGLEEGDRVVSFDGEEIATWRQFQEAVGERSPGDEANLGVERGGEREELRGTLTADERDPNRAIVGVQPGASGENYGLFESLWLGAEQTVWIIGLFGWLIGQLITGDISFYDSVSSPIGIVSVSSDVVSQGVQNFARLLAFISLNLAIFNLLPLLPLDGGHLFFIAAEKIMGRPVRAETIQRVAALGFALMIVLFLFATYADLSKIFAGQPFIPDERP